MGFGPSSEGCDVDAVLDVDGWGSASISAGSCEAGRRANDNNAGARGNEECGDGGGNTKDVGSRD